MSSGLIPLPAGYLFSRRSTRLVFMGGRVVAHSKSGLIMKSVSNVHPQLMDDSLTNANR